MNNAGHPYTQALISAIPKVEAATGEKEERILLGGDLPSPTNLPDGCAFHTRCPYATDRCRRERPGADRKGAGAFRGLPSGERLETKSETRDALRFGNRRKRRRHMKKNQAHSQRGAGRGFAGCGGGSRAARESSEQRRGQRQNRDRRRRQSDLKTLDTGYMYEAYGNMVSYAAVRHAVTGSRASTMGNPKPSLVTDKWTLDETGTVYTLPIREDVKFCQRQPPDRRGRGMEHSAGCMGLKESNATPGVM